MTSTPLISGVNDANRVKLLFDIQASAQDAHDGQGNVPVLVSFPSELLFPLGRCTEPSLKYRNIQSKSSWVVLDKTKFSVENLGVILTLQIGARYDFLGAITCSGEVHTVFGTVTLGSHCECHDVVLASLGRCEPIRTVGLN